MPEGQKCGQQIEGDSEDECRRHGRGNFYNLKRTATESTDGTRIWWPLSNAVGKARSGVSCSHLFYSFFYISQVRRSTSRNPCFSCQSSRLLKDHLHPLTHCPPNHNSSRLRHQQCVAALTRMVIHRLPISTSTSSRHPPSSLNTRLGQLVPHPRYQLQDPPSGSSLVHHPTVNANSNPSSAGTSHLTPNRYNEWSQTSEDAIPS